MTSRRCALFLPMIAAVVISACGSLECRWHWKHCDAPKAAAAADPCDPITVGINNTTCQATLTQESYWNNSVSAANVYWHFLPDQTWEQYIAIKVPVVNKVLIEKRTGTLTLSADGSVVTLSLGSSTCSGDSSLFKVFDASTQSLSMNRSGSQLLLVLSPPTVVSAQADYKNAVQSAIGHTEVAIANAVYAPFTAELWTDVVTGVLTYQSGLAGSLAATLSAGQLGCASEAGIEKVLGI